MTPEIAAGAHVGLAWAQAVANQLGATLVPDGHFGPLTAGALSRWISPAEAISPGWVYPLFPVSSRPGIDAHLDGVLSALDERGLLTKQGVLMAFATIRAESEGFVPIEELQSRWNTWPMGRPFGRYDGRADLGNVETGDGAAYRGRGFIQLTGRHNYGQLARKLGVELVEDPSLANDPQIAARILASFLADRWTHIEAALRRGDLRAARRIINGGSHGIGRFSEAFRLGLAAYPEF